MSRFVANDFCEGWPKEGKTVQLFFVRREYDYFSCFSWHLCHWFSHSNLCLWVGNPRHFSNISVSFLVPWEIRLLFGTDSFFRWFESLVLGLVTRFSLLLPLNLRFTPKTCNNFLSIQSTVLVNFLTFFFASQVQFFWIYWNCGTNTFNYSVPSCCSYWPSINSGTWWNNWLGGM